MLEHSGFGAEVAAYDRVPNAAAMPDRLASALGAVGDFKTLSAFVAAHREAGVTLPALRPSAFPTRRTTCRRSKPAPAASIPTRPAG